MFGTVTFADSREAIVVNAHQRGELLSEMRELLIASQQVLEGVITNDMEMVEKSARVVGLNKAKSTPPALAKLLPSKFKMLGPQIHKAFERIANEADGFGDTDKILKELSEMQKVCTACHAIYQIQVKN